jgi:hypothetical protein
VSIDEHVVRRVALSLLLQFLEARRAAVVDAEAGVAAARAQLAALEEVSRRAVRGRPLAL